MTIHSNPDSDALDPEEYVRRLQAGEQILFLEAAFARKTDGTVRYWLPTPPIRRGGSGSRCFGQDRADLGPDHAARLAVQQANATPRRHNHHPPLPAPAPPSSAPGAPGAAAAGRTVGAAPAHHIQRCTRNRLLNLFRKPSGGKLLELFPGRQPRAAPDLHKQPPRPD